MSSDQPSWIQNLADESLIICIDPNLYSMEALFRTCYLFTDRCYLFLEQDKEGPTIKVHFARKANDCDLTVIAGEFSNELINQKVRLDVAAETKPIRELIVAQAFAEADLFAGFCSESNYQDDPRGIAK